MTGFNITYAELNRVVDQADSAIMDENPADFDKLNSLEKRLIFLCYGKEKL